MYNAKIKAIKKTNDNDKLKQQIKELKKQVLKNNIQALADWIKGLI
jgi:hypothetical protein